MRPPAALEILPPIGRDLLPVGTVADLRRNHQFDRETAMPRPYKFTPEGRKRRQAAARETALRWRPWRFSTGPRTPEGKARSRGNAVTRGFRVELPEVVTDPEVAEAQAVWAVLRFEDMPTEHRAFMVYVWCRRLTELGEGGRIAGFPARITAAVEAAYPWLRSDDGRPGR
jgi:hypothetical protein